MEALEEQEAGSAVVLENERSSDRLVRTEEGMRRWSNNASLSQALFELAERDNLQVRAASTSVCVVWLQVGDEEVVAQGDTREEASAKAMSLALEKLKKQTRVKPEQELEERDEEKEVGKEVEEPLEDRAEEETFKEQEVTEEMLPEDGEEQSLNVSDGEEGSVVRSSGKIVLNLFSKEQAEREEQSVTETEEEREKIVDNSSSGSESETCLKEEREATAEEMLLEETQELSLNVSAEERSAPGPSSTVESEEEGSGRFGNLLHYWLSKEKKVCGKEQERVIKTEEKEITEDNGSSGSESETGVKEEREATAEEMLSGETQEQSLNVSAEERSAPGPSTAVESEIEREATAEEMPSEETQKQSLNVSDEERSAPGPSAAVESEIEREAQQKRCFQKRHKSKLKCVR
ncbi:hypothetical protein WMY93_025524 [Mugilogobius chulae]|uniref:Uncharacterized protein n=1 Tax=Mugilogobius chulae TaxID=88201 RepID=A0AAW0N5W4_9GOBI